MTNKKIGKYEIIRELGKGATSVVYEALDPFVNRHVAMKVVMQEALGDKEHGRRYRKLFVTEASLAGKLSHPHIVSIYDAVADDEASYIVMEYVDGTTLEQYSRPENLLPINKVIEIVFKCTKALDYAAKHGVIHRDIKPANVMLSGENYIKITDFGAAQTTATETTQITGIGSPVIIDSSTELAPSSTVPSTGTFSPGRTRNVSPTTMASIATSLSWPFASTLSAVRGASPSSALIARLMVSGVMKGLVQRHWM